MMHQAHTHQPSPAHHHQGYVALLSVLIIMAILTVVGTSVSLLAITDVQLSLAQNLQEKATNLVHSCIEEELLTLNKINTITTSVSTPQGNCQVVIDSQVGNNWTFTVHSTAYGYTKAVQVTASRSATIDVSSLKQVN